jgi:hypothetical protein
METFECFTCFSSKGSSDLLHLFLFVDFDLSLDKLARKIYLSGKFYVQVGRGRHGNSTPLHRTQHLIKKNMIDILVIEWETYL